MITYRINGDITAKDISDLRKSVGWNGMEKYYRKSISNSYLYICCYSDGSPIGFLDVVSNGVTDAYIQDVVVDPRFQKKGIGTNLINMAIEKLKSDNIYSISVLFEEALLGFYKKFGFNIMMAGQLETHQTE